jgi:hypothetical protein
MVKKKYQYLPDGYIPTKEEANKYIARTYSAKTEVGDIKEKTIVKLFREVPENKDISNILVKCATLNSLASTNIIDVFYIAEHIQELKIDERLKHGDLNLVDEIGKKINVGSSKRSHYSFASKYCSYHHPLKYSIYDRYVALVLTELQKRDYFSDFKRAEDLKKYERYMKALEDFRNFYGFPEKEYSKKDLDKYLWLLGKEWVKKQKE